MKNKLSSTIIKFVFVFFQFGGILILLLTGPVFTKIGYLLALEISGILLGFWAVFSMQLSNLRILPDPKTDAVFVQSGPYRIIRHPMYLAILITLIPLVISEYSPFRLIILIILFCDLVFKLLYEESLLKKAFSNYISYMKKSYRLIPYIF